MPYMNGTPTLAKAWNITRPTDEIVDSLRPCSENKEQLRVKPDGRVFQGNIRIKVLEERGYPVNDLPRDVIP